MKDRVSRMLDKHTAGKHVTSSNCDKFDPVIYCEHDVLSIRNPGHRVPVFDKDKYEEDIPYLKTDELQELLDVSAALFDLSTVNPKGPFD